MIKPPAEIARQQRTVYRQIADCLQTGIVCVALLVGLTGCVSNDREATTYPTPGVVLPSTPLQINSETVAEVMTQADQNKELWMR